MLLDMYPKGPFDAQPYQEGQDPFEIAPWFDAGNYTISRNFKYGNLWIQGGPRMRMFFTDLPEILVGLHMLGAALVAAGLARVVLTTRAR